MPSDLVIQTNMNDLARYALICQDVGLVPIIEPDVSLTGSHTLEAAVAINTKIQAALYRRVAAALAIRAASTSIYAYTR